MGDDWDEELLLSVAKSSNGGRDWFNLAIRVRSVGQCRACGPATSLRDDNVNVSSVVSSAAFQPACSWLVARGSTSQGREGQPALPAWLCRKPTATDGRWVHPVAVSFTPGLPCVLPGTAHRGNANGRQRRAT